MPDIFTKATVGVELNTQPAKHKIAELEAKLDALNAKKQKFLSEGNFKAAAKMQGEINKVSRQLENARTASKRCQAALEKLNQAAPNELRMTLRMLKDDLNHIQRGSSAWRSHVEAIKKVKAELKSVNAELSESESFFSRANRKINEWGMSVGSAVAGFTGLVFTARQAVQAFADMEAEMANVRKFTGMTADEVNHLNEQFKQMDTRTSREDLNKLAQEAGRLGLQSEQDVLGFVRAADQINVALDDLGEGATLTLSKLTDIFGDRQRLGVEQSLLAVGSVVNELSQNCTASAPYLTDFSQRLAGVGKQANMTIPQIMGFAAVLDSQGQAVEMSATALSQLIMKLFQDPAKIAKATGMNLQAFTQVLKEDTNQALLMLLDRLHEMGDISALAPVFDAMGTDGARASAVIAALAGNVDTLRQQQLNANVAFKQATSVTNEYNVQNNTVQAQLDKAKKRFHDMAVELGEKLAPAMKYAISGSSALMHVLSALTSFFFNHKGLVVNTILAIVSYTVAVKASAMAHAAWNVVAKTTRLVMSAVEATVIAVKYAYFLFTDQLRKADVAQKAFNKSVKANPMGIVIALISMAIGAIVEYTSKIDENRKKAEEAKKANDEWVKSLTDISQASSEYCSGEIARLKALYREATKKTNSDKKRISAAKELQSIYPTVFGNLSTETIMTGKASSAYDQLTKSIINSARARAAAAKIEQNEKELLELEDKLTKQTTARNKAQQTANTKQKAAEDTYRKNKNIIEGSALGDSREMNSQNTRTAVYAVASAREAASAAYNAITAANNAIAQTKEQISTLEKANETLAAKYNVATTQLQPQKTVNVPSPASYFKPVNATAGSKGGKATTVDDKKRKEDEEKQKRIDAVLQSQEFKDELALLQKNLDERNKLAKDAYFKGRMDYASYLDYKHNSAVIYYDEAADLYKKYNVEEAKEAAELKKKKNEEDVNYSKDHKKLILDQLAYQRDVQKVNAKMEFYNPDNAEAFKNQRVLDDKLAQIDIEYLQKVMDAESDDVKAREDARLNLEKAKQEEAMRQRKQLEADLSAWLYLYTQKGANDRMNAELAVVDELHKQGKIKTEEAEEAKAAIRKKYRDEVNAKTGTKAKNQDFDDAKETRDKQLAALEDAHNQGLVSQEEYESRKWQIVQNYHNKIVELISGDGNEWATMVSRLVETWKAGFETLGSTLPEKLKSIAAMAASAFAVMNAGVKAYTDYANASRDLELAKVEKNYQAQIDAAGKNDKKKKALEEKKAAAIAKIKTKYDKRAMAMELAQAVSSTAMAAINAYASAAAVPVIGHVIAPIAASMALAAGALQIATIKKSHQTQQAGYYEGGFTSRALNNRREVGVVHANEFVANHKAVANPELLPVLRLIDQAQRNNTVASLTSADVSRALGQGALLGEATATQLRSAGRDNRSMQLVAASMEQQTAAINELNNRLADGIESYMVMDGERGFDRSWQRYQRMKNNPRR